MFHPTGRSPRCGMPLEYDCREFLCLENYKNQTVLFVKIEQGRADVTPREKEANAAVAEGREGARVFP